MVVYTLYGYLFPRWLDFFWHPGTTFHRVVTSSTVEYSTGIYGPYPQLALTLVAAFLLLAAAARGFDAQNAMVAVMRRLAGRSRHMVPQTAVLASVSVGMISGNGITCAIFGRFTENLGTNIILRAALALVSFVTMLHPDGNVAAAAAALVLPATIYGVARHRRIAPAKSGALPSQPAG